MMNKISILFLGLACLLSLSQVNAQHHDLLLYNYKDVAQSSLLNPGIRTNQRVSVGLFQVGAMANSSSFSAYDVMGRGTVFNDNVETILAGLGNNDFIRSNVNTNVFFTSFNFSKRLQFSFGAMIGVNQHIELPENIIRLVARGNAQFENKLVEFGGWSAEISAMASVHAGASYVVNDKLTVGARIYRHNGILNAHMRRRDNSLNINFDPDVWTVETDVRARGSFIGEEIFVIQDENIRINNIGIESVNDVLSLLDLSENVGYSIDLGAEYVFNKRWSVSASILGLGGINYTANPQQISSNGTFAYTGINYDLRTDTWGYGALIDSLLNLYNPEISGANDYRRGLPTQVFTEVQYNLSRMNEFHGIVRYTNWLGRDYFDFNLRYLFKPTRFFSAMANISTTQAVIFGGGVGFQLYAPGFQFFLMADIMTNNISVSHFRGAMIQTGANFTLWDRSERRARKRAKKEAEREDVVTPLPQPNESDSSAASDSMHFQENNNPNELIESDEHDALNFGSINPVDIYYPFSISDDYANMFASTIDCHKNRNVSMAEAKNLFAPIIDNLKNHQQHNNQLVNIDVSYSI